MALPTMITHLRTTLTRLLGSSVSLLGVVALVFVVVRVVPGDPVDHLLGEQATDADRAALRGQMHLDGPLSTQFAGMIGDFADGSLGTSYALRGAATPVRTLIARHLPHTVALALGAVCWAILIALPLGVGAALLRDRAFDHGARLMALLAVCMPAFVSGPLALYLFAVLLHWLPTPADEVSGLRALLLPSAVIGFALSGRLARLLRATMLEQLRAEYGLAARARGISSIRIVLGHALPNAILPVLTVLGLQLAALLGGALVTEKIFGRPGIGSLLLEGIAMRDHAVVQGCVVVIGIAYMLINGGVDMIYRLVDPRLRGVGEKAS